MRLSTSNVSNLDVYTQLAEEMQELGMNPDILGNVGIQNLSADLSQYRAVRASDYR